MVNAKRTAHAKFNWPKIKNEFLNSDYLEVKSFFEDRYKTYNATIRGKTVGWTEDKKERDQRIANRVLKEQEDTEVASKVAILKDILAKIAARVAIGKENLYALEAAWRVYRTECNLPTSISKLTSANLNKIITQPLTPDEMKEIDEALNEFGIEQPTNKTTPKIPAHTENLS